MTINLRLLHKGERYMTKTQLYNSKIRKDAEKINLAFYYEHLKIQLALQDT